MSNLRMIYYCIVTFTIDADILVSVMQNRIHSDNYYDEDDNPENMYGDADVEILIFMRAMIMTIMRERERTANYGKDGHNYQDINIDTDNVYLANMHKDSLTYTNKNRMTGPPKELSKGGTLL